MVNRMFDRIGDSLLHFFAVKAIGFHFDFTGGNLDQGLGDAEFDERIKIGLYRTLKAPDFRFQSGIQDTLDRTRVCFGDAWEAGLDSANA